MSRATNEAPSTATFQQHSPEAVQGAQPRKGGEVKLKAKRAYLIYNPVAGAVGVGDSTICLCLTTMVALCELRGCDALDMLQPPCMKTTAASASGSCSGIHPVPQ